MTYATVRAANGTELGRVRGNGQWSKLYLAIFQPSEVYSATLASLPSSSDSVVEISFSGGSGTLSDVLPDMTLFVGSTAGAYDYGVARIRKAPIAGVFYIGEESDIYWEVGCHLTVVNEFDLWAKHIRTVDDETFYMDWDVSYVDQNSSFNPIPIMGGHRVLKLTGASVSTQFDWSNSYCIGSSITGYSVSCPTASITSGTTSSPTLQFSSEGWHMVVLTVTAANGKTSVGVRYVYVYSVSAMPATVFQLENCYEDYETGGWVFSVTMQDEIELSNVPDRTMCILFAEDYYGDTQVSHGQLSGCENIICVGKIAEEATSLDPEQSEVSLTIYGMQYWFEKVYAFPTGAILKTSAPSNWAEMQSPTVDKILFRLLHWGCTATKIMDIYLTSDTRIASELTSPASNLWSQIQEISFSTIYARPGVDRFGRMFVEVEPQVVPVASRTWPSVMTIGKKDWHDSVRIQRVVVTPQSMVNASGVYVLSNGTGGALFSLSPGHVFKHYGSPEVIDRLLLSTQGASNQFSGLALNWKNNQFPNSEMQLCGNNRMIDCFPRQKVTWQVDAVDTPRAFSFNKGFIPRRVEFHWEDETGFLSTAVSLEMETVEGIYTNGDVPGSGDYDPVDPPSPPNLPPLPGFPPIFPSDQTPLGSGGPRRVLLYSTGTGVIYTENFNESSPTWTLISGGLTGWKVYMGNRMFATPSGAICVACLGKMSNAQRGTDDQNAPWIARAPSPGGTFEIIKDENTLWVDYPATLNTHGIFGIGYNPLVADSIACVMGEGVGLDTTNCHFWIGAGGELAQGVAIPRVSLSHASGRITYGLNTWMYIAQRAELGDNGTYWKVNAAGSGLLASGTGIWAISEGDHLRASTTGIMMVIDSANARVRRSIDNGASWITLTAGTAYQGDVDPTGQYLMSAYNNKSRSADGGGSWSGIPNLPAGGAYYFKYAGGEGVGSRWIAARGVVRLSLDYGETWLNKEGNIYEIDPTLDVKMIHVLEY